MISFKLFVEAIHHAIVAAGDSLMNKNKELLEEYFVETSDSGEPGKNVLVPKMVRLEYPTLNDQGNVISSMLQVPLITLVPITEAKIEKATVTAEFLLDIVNDELQIDFLTKKTPDSKGTYGKLEIVISPQETSEGLNLIIDGYTNILKRQIT